MRKKLLKVMLILTSILSFIFAIVTGVVGVSGSGYVSYSKYGGDAYTGIQNAAAATANRVSSLQETFAMAAAFLFVIISIVLFSVAISIKCDKKVPAMPQQPPYFMNNTMPMSAPMGNTNYYNNAPASVPTSVPSSDDAFAQPQNPNQQ